MNLSDWLALAACIAAFLGLIPPFYQILKKKKEKKDNKKKSGILESTQSPPINDSKLEEKKLEEKKEQPPMLKALILTIMAIVIFVIEIILFKAVAYMFGVAIDVNTMSLVWSIVFYSLFLIPGLLLFFALNVVLTLFEW